MGKKSASYSKKRSGKTESWSVRKSDGQLEIVRTAPKSAASMDRAVKRYESALKRLAKR